MVSPIADDDPELTHRVNVGGARTIIRAVQARPDPDSVGLVMVGSVAELGDRSPPNHWGRVGDPVRVAQFDEYALSKVIAERELVDSGLHRWAWLRMPGIFHAGMLEIRDPIMTHPPLEGVMVSVSASDGARLLANLCEDDVPEEFWGGVHDVGGGEGWRLTNGEFHTRVMAALGIRDIRRWYDRNWFATRNFHGQWFADSDRLQQLVPFRQDTFDSALKHAARTAPRSVRLAGKFPATLVRHFVVKPLLHQPRGTLAWPARTTKPASTPSSAHGSSGNRSATGRPSGHPSPTARPTSSTTATTRPRIPENGRNRNCARRPPSGAEPCAARMSHQAPPRLPYSGAAPRDTISPPAPPSS